VDFNRAWKTVLKNRNISANDSVVYYELKQHKLYLDEGCSELPDQRKQAEVQLLQDLTK
jgi:hypothetical protein